MKRRYAAGSLALTSFLAVGPLAPAGIVHAITDSQIRTQCESGVAKCTYDNVRPISAPYLARGQRVSEVVTNCTSSPIDYTLTWSQTTGTTTSSGVEVTAAYKAAVEMSVKTSFSRSWNSSKTESSTLKVTAHPGEQVWVERQAVVQDISGDLATHYDATVDGHYIWYLNDQRLTVPPIESTSLQPTIKGASKAATC